MESFIRGTKQCTVCVLLLFLSRGQGKEDCNEVKKMRHEDASVVWPIKNVHFLNIIVGERLCDGSHGDGAGVCLRACMCVFM